MQNKSLSKPVTERKTQSRSLYEQSSQPLQFMQVQTKNPGIKILQANYVPAGLKQQPEQNQRTASNNLSQQQTYAVSQPTYNGPPSYTMNKYENQTTYQNKASNQPTYYHGGYQNYERNKFIESPPPQADIKYNQSKSIPPKSTIQNSPQPKQNNNYNDLNKKIYTKQQANPQPTYFQQQITLFPNRNQQSQDQIRVQASTHRQKNFYDGEENVNDDESTYMSQKSTNLTVSQIRKDKIQSPFQSQVRPFESFRSDLLTIRNKCIYCNQQIQGTQLLLQCNHFFCEKCFQAHVDSLLMKLQYSYIKCLCGQRIKLQFLGKEQNTYYRDQISKVQLNQMKTQYSKYIDECSNRCSFFWVKSDNKNFNYVRPYCPNCLGQVNRKNY